MRPRARPRAARLDPQRLLGRTRSELRSSVKVIEYQNPSPMPVEKAQEIGPLPGFDLNANGHAAPNQTYKEKYRTEFHRVASRPQCRLINAVLLSLSERTAFFPPELETPQHRVTPL